jgi:Calcineurin-like phosphoesterase
MRLRPAAVLLVIAAAALVVGLNGAGDEPSGGDAGSVAAAKARAAYLGPPGGGRGWLRSRAKQRTIVWAVGDAADGGPDSREVAAMIGSHRVDRFLYLGDVYERGTAREFEVNYRPLYGRYDQSAGPTIGNHEWANVATGYVPYWTAARGKPPPFWYASAASGWQLISLNSNAPISTSPDQLGWVRSKIERSPRYGTCRIAFMHHPTYSAGLHGGLAALQPVLAELEGNASILLSGHDHDMQRLRPISGITQLVSGSGGRELYPVNRNDPRLAFYDDTHHGAVRLKLRPGRAVVSFVASDGSLLDRSAVSCRQR